MKNNGDILLIYENIYCKNETM